MKVKPSNCRAYRRERGISLLSVIGSVIFIVLIAAFRLLLMRILSSTSTMQFIIVLLMTLMVSAVTTFGPVDWMKDVLDYEHCGSVWITPDIVGNSISSDRQRKCSITAMNFRFILITTETFVSRLTKPTELFI